MDTLHYSTPELYFLINKMYEIEQGLITHILLKFIPKYLIYGINKEKHSNDNTLIKYSENLNRIEMYLMIDLFECFTFKEQLNINIIKQNYEIIYKWNTEREQIITSFLDLNGIPYIKKYKDIFNIIKKFSIINNDFLYKEIQKYKSCSQVLIYINNKYWSVIWNIGIFYENDFAEILLKTDEYCYKFSSPDDFRENLISKINRITL